MGSQLLLTFPPVDSEEDKKRVTFVNKNNNLDKFRVEDKVGVVKEESDFIKLSLGICAQVFEEQSKRRKVIPVFTINQLIELHQQVLVFNHIAAGVSVPSQLFIPIWKWLASSVFGTATGGFHSYFSSYFCPESIDYNSFMDPEPGRCRRTDGKKWRCRKDVIPNTKYCERHMHRGRGRYSRKPVEAAAITLQSNTPTTTFSHPNIPTIPSSKMTRETIKSRDPADTSTNFPSLIPENHQNSTLSLCTFGGLTASSATINKPSSDGRSKTDDAFVKVDKFFRSTTSSACNDNDDNISNRKNITPTIATTKFNITDSVNVFGRDLDVLDVGSKHFKDGRTEENSTIGNKNGGSMTPEFSTSSKSFVHVDTIIKNNNLVFCNHRYITAWEPQRCKRTDGKRWQCSKEAIPRQKYCDGHMHRGSKRLKLLSKVVTVAASHVPLAIPINDHTNLNTDLSISLAKSPQPSIIDLDSSTSDSSSDATTVTDDNTSVSDFLVLPP